MHVSSVSSSPDGSTVASGSRDGTIRLWDAMTGEEKATLQGHTDWVRSVSFSPDGSILASGSWDDTVRLWNVVTGEEKATLRGHTDPVDSVSFSPDGSILASGMGRHGSSMGRCDGRGESDAEGTYGACQ